MITYCILSAVFFVLYILFQGLQSVGEKLNDITRTYESKKPEDENSFAQRCKRQIEYEKTLIPDSEELRKVREDFKKAYYNFAIDKIIKYDDVKKEELYNNKGIIRNKLKINASINNSAIFKEIQKEYGSFSKYLLSFIHEYPIYETGLTTSQLSDSISKDLIKRGMKFTGSTIIYSYLQAIGIINSHETECFLHKK